MIYFLLPRTYLYTYRHLEYIECDTTPVSYISNSLSHYLSNIKERITEHENEWDTYKKYTNPYEYIHTNLPNKKKCISKHKPLSRSYFKMTEIVHFFNLFNSSMEDAPLGSNINPTYSTRSQNQITEPIRTFHLAEGPGGFIESFLELRNNPLDKYIGMTILDDKNDLNVPSWKKSGQFMKEHQNNVFIENGADQTGNILNLRNFVHCKNKYDSSMDFITADGGFDFSMDFKNQENNISRLLFAQIAYAVCMQKQNGNFVLKIFDSFMLHTIDMLYLLSSFYEKVYICKPQTSRFANSEKYIVCKKFIFSSNRDFYPYFYNCFEKMTYSPPGIVRPIGRFLNVPISNLFITRLEEYNSIFGQQQMENIYNTIVLIETKYRNEKIETLIKNNIQKSIHWCIKYKVPHQVFL